MEIEKLFVSLALNASKYTQGLADAQKEGQSWAARMRKSIGGGLQTAAKIGGAAVLGLGTLMAGTAAAGVNQFIGFENQMNEVFTLLPGISGDAMDEMTGQVQQFSKDFAVLPNQVVPALYQSLSAGVPPDNVFDFLETAQKAAVGGVTDLETAVDGITSVVNAYGSDVVDAANASDVMFTAVRLGKTNFEQLSASLFNVIPTAASLGIKFEEVAAGLATLTAQGTPTSVATTQLRQLFVEASKSGSNLDNTIRSLTGQGIAGLIADGRTVTDVLQEVRDSVGDEEFRNMFGSVEALNAALGITGPNVEAMTTNMDAMNDSVGATDAAYGTMNKGIKRSIERFKAFGSVALLQVGDALSPLIDKALELGERALPFIETALATVTGVMENFAKILSTTRGEGGVLLDYLQELPPSIQPIASAIGEATIWIEDFIKAIVTAPDEGGVLMDYLQELPLAIQPIASFLAELNIKFHEIAPIVKDAVTQFVSWKDVLIAAGMILGGVLLNAVIGIVAALAPVIIAVGAVIGVIALLRNAWENDWGGIQEKVQAVIGFVVPLVQEGIAFIQQFWAENGDAILAKAQEVWTAVSDAVLTAVDFIWNGVILPTITLLQQFWDAHGAAIVESAKRAWTAIVTNIEAVIKIIKTAVEAFQSAFRGDWETFGAKLAEIWKLAWELMIKQVTDLWNILQPVLGSFWTSIKNWFDTVDWKALGTAIIQGIAAGVSGAVGVLKDAVNSAAQSALDAAKAALGIGSPSKLFEQQVGKNVMLGIISGLNKMGPELDSAMSRVALPSFAAAGTAGLVGAAAGGGSTTSYSSQTTVQLAPGDDPLRALRASRHLDKLGGK